MTDQPQQSRVEPPVRAMKRTCAGLDTLEAHRSAPRLRRARDPHVLLNDAMAALEDSAIKQHGENHIACNLCGGFERMDTTWPLHKVNCLFARYDRLEVKLATR